MMKESSFKLNLLIKIIFFLCATGLSPLPVLAKPVVLYTDITSGPNTGGENNNGIYLTIFGVGFASSRGSSVVKINGVEVADYIYWGTAIHGRDNAIQQISVQPGSSVTSGAMKVTVNGVDSNTDHSFTVITGDIYFVDSQTGNNGTATKNDKTKPWKTVEDAYDEGDFGAGDTIVMLQGHTETAGSPWIRKDGGSPGKPVTIMGYPGSNPPVIKQNSDGYGMRGDSTSSGYWQICGFEINGNDSSRGAIYHLLGNSSRLVNMKIHNHETGSTGVIREDHMENSMILGNQIYDNYTSKEGHLLYLGTKDGSGDLDDCVIAYNLIHTTHGSGGGEEFGGNLIQIRTQDPVRKMKNWKIHSNILHTAGKNAIGVDETATTGWEIYNNIAYNLGNGDSSCGFVRTRDGGCTPKIYNNTVYDSPVAVDKVVNSASTEIKNNIFYMLDGQDYFVDTISNITINTNCYYGAGNGPGKDGAAINSDPLFVSVGSDFHLQSGSPAIGKGLTLQAISHDFDGRSRPTIDPNIDDNGYELGAYEFGTNPPNNAPPDPPENVRIIDISQ